MRALDLRLKRASRVNMSTLSASGGVDGAVNVDCVGSEGIPNTIVFRRQAAVFPSTSNFSAAELAGRGGSAKAILDFV